jgi:hypothetical protein
LQDFSIDLRRYGNFNIVGETTEQREEEGEEREGLGQLRVEEPMLNSYHEVVKLSLYPVF